MKESDGKAPRWFAVVILVLLLPLFQMPYLLSVCPADSPARTFIWIYPFYALLSGYLAWQCYAQRRALAWILLILLLMSHTAIWFMATTPV